jgi:hypothetical protein
VTNGDNERESLTPPLNAAIIASLLIAEVKEKELSVRVIWLQATITIIVTGITAYFSKNSQQIAIAVLCGGGVSILNNAMLTWRMIRSALHSNHDAHHQLMHMYFYAIERFLVIVLLLGICLVVIKFSPLALIGGFVLGQTVLVLARLIFKDID